MDRTLQRPVRFFFFNDPATTQIYTLSLHDALPIYIREEILQIGISRSHENQIRETLFQQARHFQDRKSTRLNSSHANISYAVFCLKKKNTQHHGESKGTELRRECGGVA